MENPSQFRNLIDSSDSIAFGCSHTWGVGVDANETWSYNLDAMNFGVGSCSADFIVRIAPDLVDQYCPKTVYVLWPDWTRFEYIKNGVYMQSLPTDSDRIYFMETHTEEWLKNNFRQQVDKMNQYCNQRDIQLIDMSLYDLIPYIDHADQWPISKLGHHYDPSWHKQVADIFQNAKINNIRHPIANE
jgi:hypothetical protein